MDKAALRARVRALTGVQMVELLSNAEIDDWVNEAYREVASLAPWSFLYEDGTVSTAAGTASYALPGTIKVAETVAIPSGANRRLLRRRQLGELDRMPDHMAGQAVPWAWAAQADGQFEVFPPPDAAYTLKVRGRNRVAELVAETDAPVFDAEFHPAVAYVASVFVFDREGDDSGRADEYLRVAASYVTRMAHRYLDSPDVLTPMVLAGRLVGEQPEEGGE